jgi:hypothetical protein
MMPPSGAPRPDRATLDRFAAAVESTIDRPPPRPIRERPGSIA